MIPNRREFLSQAKCVSSIVIARCGLTGAVATAWGDYAGSAEAAPVQASSFCGACAGEQRAVDDFTLCWCPPGRFLMGSAPDEPNHRPDECQVEVTLTDGFWMAKCEVTQRQWKKIVGKFPDKPPTAEFGAGDDFPVYWVNFAEAMDFCTRLTDLAHRSGALPNGWEFTLPTEAQWEYACRAGTATATSFGDEFNLDQANFNGELLNGSRGATALGRAARVGSYAANPWNICDMHGNVWEWCQDWYHTRLPGGTNPDLSDEKGAPNRDGTYSRVRRGGAWIESGWACRSACRLRYEPARRSDHIGFRVVAVQL